MDIISGGNIYFSDGKQTNFFISALWAAKDASCVRVCVFGSDACVVVDWCWLFLANMVYDWLDFRLSCNWFFPENVQRKPQAVVCPPKSDRSTRTKSTEKIVIGKKQISAVRRYRYCWGVSGFSYVTLLFFLDKVRVIVYRTYVGLAIRLLI